MTDMGINRLLNDYEEDIKDSYEREDFNRIRRLMIELEGILRVLTIQSNPETKRIEQILRETDELFFNPK